jgi:hypothetical protein
MEIETVYRLLDLAGNIGGYTLFVATGYFTAKEVWKQEAKHSLRDLDEAVKLAYDCTSKNPGTPKEITIQVLSDIKRDTEKEFGVHLRHTRNLIDTLKGGNE